MALIYFNFRTLSTLLILVVFFGYLYVTESTVSTPLLTSKRSTSYKYNINIESYHSDETQQCSYSPFEFTSYSQYIQPDTNNIEYSVSFANISMKKRYAFIILLIIVILRQILTKSTTNNQTTKTKDRHRIVFGGSGGLLVYQFGVFKAILEHFGAEIFLKQCTFEGVSGGAAVAFFSLACMHGCDTINSVYTNALSLPAYTASNKPFGMLWTSSDLIYKIMYDHIKIWSKGNGGKIPKWLWSECRVAAWVTRVDVFNLKNVLWSIDTQTIKASDIDSIANWYATAAKTTTLVPLVLSKQLYCCADDKKYIDGYISMSFGDKTIFKTKNMYNEHCKVLYINCDLINYLKRRRYNQKTFENGNIVYYLDIWKWTKFSYLDYAIWGNKKYCDNLYQKGYDLAKQNITEIENVLNDFLSFKDL